MSAFDMYVEEEENDTMRQITEAAVVNSDPLPGVDHLQLTLSILSRAKDCWNAALCLTLI